MNIQASLKPCKVRREFLVCSVTFHKVTETSRKYNELHGRGQSSSAVKEKVSYQWDIYKRQGSVRLVTVTGDDIKPLMDKNPNIPTSCISSTLGVIQSNVVCYLNGYHNFQLTFLYAGTFL